MSSAGKKPIMANAQNSSKERLGTYNESLTQASKKEETTRQTTDSEPQLTNIFNGGPGGIRTRDLPVSWLASLANRTFFGPINGHTRLNYRPHVPIRGKSTFNLSETS
jgi:hypothetical protein